LNQTLKPKIGFQVIQGKPQYVQVTIPNDWKLEPFEKHYELIKGKIPKTLFETNGIGKLPYLTSGYLKGDDEEYAEKSDGVLVNESDVIMIGDGDGSGRVYTANNGILASTFVLLKKKDSSKIDTRFVFYYLQHKYPFFRYTRYGTGIPHLDQHILNNLWIPVLEKKEEEKIISIFSNIDRIQNLIDTKIEKLKLMKKAIIEKLLSVGLENKKPQSVDWYYGKQIEIPEGWEYTTLSAVIHPMRYGTSKKSNDIHEGIPVIGISNIKFNKIIYDDADYVDLTSREINAFSLDYGDILIIRTNANLKNLGQCAMFDNVGTWGFASFLMKIKPNLDRIDPRFLLILLNSNFIRNQIPIIAQTTVGKYNINKENLGSLKIILPSLPEQIKIIDISSNIDSEIQPHEDYKLKLESIKQYFMNNLLNGNVRVKI
jgi:type I restriction enzyme, S subunit